MLKGKGRFYLVKQKGAINPYIYISARIARDSQFPFEHLDRLKIEVVDEKMIIEKVEDDV